MCKHAYHVHLCNSVTDIKTAVLSFHFVDATATGKLANIGT